jgi:hypothetical protein
MVPSDVPNRSKTTKILQNQRYKSLPKEHNNLPVANPKEMEILRLTDKEFKILVLEKLNKLQGKKRLRNNSLKSGK